VDGVSAETQAEERTPLRGGKAVELHATGFLLPAGGRLQFTPYGELIHVVAGARGLRLGTERGTLFLPRAAFAEPGAAGALAARLRERIGALPDGERRLERQRVLDVRQADPARPNVGAALAGLCLAFWVLQGTTPEALQDGEYWGFLGLTREPWRIVTSQLLHANFVHFALNAFGLLVLGGWLERQLGAARTWLVAVLSGAGAIVACAFAGYLKVVGASGVVMGFGGALIALELRRPDLLPALLRLPRGLLVGAALADFVLLSFVPNVAHAAHVGGLLAGGGVALALAPRDAGRLWPGPALRAACAAALVPVVVALGFFAYGLLDPASAAARRGERLLDDRDAPALLLNNEAWRIATAAEASEDELELALRLARRAVRATERNEPNLLDTLAEVYFKLGRNEEAVETIDQAIRLAPGVAYFVEQRRRFTGERASDDRPAPPGEELPEEEDAPPFEPVEDAPAIRV
jgi:membrane associated rhomboid family serine protease